MFENLGNHVFYFKQCRCIGCPHELSSRSFFSRRVLFNNNKSEAGGFYPLFERFWLFRVTIDDSSFFQWLF